MRVNKPCTSSPPVRELLSDNENEHNYIQSVCDVLGFAWQTWAPLPGAMYDTTVVLSDWANTLRPSSKGRKFKTIYVNRVEYSA